MRRIHVPRFRVATLEEVAHYGRANLPKGLKPPIMGASGPALVGSMGTVNSTSGNTANSPTYGTGESHSAGNLGILFVGSTRSTGTGTAPGTPTGWTAIATATATSNSAGLFFRALDGSSTDLPTVAAATNMSWRCSLAEFTGVNTTGADKFGSTTTGTTSATATNSAADTASGELLVAVASAHTSTTTLTSETFVSNLGASSGTTALTQSNNDTLSGAGHMNAGFGITTSNAAADDAVFTPGLTATTLIVICASFQAGTIVPLGSSVVSTAVSRASLW